MAVLQRMFTKQINNALGFTKFFIKVQFVWMCLLDNAQLPERTTSTFPLTLYAIKLPRLSSYLCLCFWETTVIIPQEAVCQENLNIDSFKFSSATQHQAKPNATHTKTECQPSHLQYWLQQCYLLTVYSCISFHNFTFAAFIYCKHTICFYLRPLCLILSH